MTMKRILATILVLLTTSMLSTAVAQEYTPEETVVGLTMLFAVENDALLGCPAELGEYDACAQLSYSTQFMTRTLVDRWFRGFSDTRWLTGWMGDDVVVVRMFALDDYPGEVFGVAVGEVGSGTVIVFQWADE